MPRVSLGLIMVLVLGVAIDFALIRRAETDDAIGYVIYVCLVMANILALGTYRLRSEGRGASTFLKGFIICGVAAFILNLTLALAFRQEFEEVFSLAIDPIGNFYDTHISPAVDSSPILRPMEEMWIAPLISSIFALPQLGMALVGGFAARRIAARRQIV